MVKCSGEVLRPPLPVSAPALSVTRGTVLNNKVPRERPSLLEISRITAFTKTAHTFSRIFRVLPPLVFDPKSEDVLGARAGQPSVLAALPAMLKLTFWAPPSALGGGVAALVQRHGEVATQPMGRRKL